MTGVGVLDAGVDRGVVARDRGVVGRDRGVTDPPRPLDLGVTDPDLLEGETDFFVAIFFRCDLPRLVSARSSSSSSEGSGVIGEQTPRQQK